MESVKEQSSFFDIYLYYFATTVIEFFFSFEENIKHGSLVYVFQLHFTLNNSSRKRIRIVIPKWVVIKKKKKSMFSLFIQKVKVIKDKTLSYSKSFCRDLILWICIKYFVAFWNIFIGFHCKLIIVILYLSGFLRSL